MKNAKYIKSSRKKNIKYVFNFLCGVEITFALLVKVVWFYRTTFQTKLFLGHRHFTQSLLKIVRNEISFQYNNQRANSLVYYCIMI